MTTTTKLGITQLEENQAGAHIVVNDAQLLLEWGATGGQIVDRDLATPPGSPTLGAAYLVATSPTGAWSGMAGKIAISRGTGNGWLFVTPTEGLPIYVQDENLALRYDGAAWSQSMAVAGAIFYAYDVGGGLAIGNGSNTFLLWDTEGKKDAGYTHTADDDDVTVAAAGIYSIHVDLGITHGGTVAGVDFWIEKNTVELPGTRASACGDGSTITKGSCTIRTVVTLAASDVLRINSNRYAGASGVTTLANACRWYIEKIG